METPKKIQMCICIQYSRGGEGGVVQSEENAKAEWSHAKFAKGLRLPKDQLSRKTSQHKTLNNQNSAHILDIDLKGPPRKKTRIPEKQKKTKKKKKKDSGETLAETCPSVFLFFFVFFVVSVFVSFFFVFFVFCLSFSVFSYFQWCLLFCFF